MPTVISYRGFDVVQESIGKRWRIRKHSSAEGSYLLRSFHSFESARDEVDRLNRAARRG